MDIQAAIDAAPVGGTVVVPAGETVNVDAVNAQIRPKNGITFQVDGTLQALPSTQRNSQIVLLDHASDVTIIVSGQIIGDADTHQGAATDDAGHGIAMYGASNITVRGNGTITRCHGDGVYIDRACKNIALLETWKSTGNMRQGLSVIDVDGLNIDGPSFLNTGALPPSAGIDFEPDRPVGVADGEQAIRNVKMRNCAILGNGGASVLIACPPSARSNIDIDGSNKMDKHPIDGTDGVVPFWAKWLFYVIKSYRLYPRSIRI